MEPLSFEFLPADLFGLGSVERAALAADPDVAGLTGLTSPRRIEHVPIPEDRLDAEERTLLATRWEERLLDLEPPVAVLDGVRALATPGTCVVVTGQQPGFLGGPLLHFHKALHAVRLARALAEHWERPVVPVFWNHADDHDVSESHHLTLVNENLDPRRVSLAGMGSTRIPLGVRTLDREEHRLDAIAGLVRTLVHESDRRDGVLDLFLPRHGETLARAFSRTLTGLLGHLGLVVLEPEWIRDDLSRALAHLVADDPRRALEAGSAELAAAGHEASIDPTDAALVYRVEERGRLPLRLGGEGFRYDGETGSRTPTELAAEIVQEPGAWSAGALLRPLVQDLALPVAAYVGGWGEWRYHAQLGPLRRARGVPATPFVPRLGATFVDPEAARAFERAGGDFRDLVAGRLDAPPAETTTGGERKASTRLREIAERAARELLDAREDMAEVDRGLAIQLKRTASQVRALVDKVATRADRVSRNRRGKERRHVRRLESWLFPGESPQERRIGVLPFVARFDTDWIDELAGRIEPFPTEHLLVRFGPGPDEP